MHTTGEKTSLSDSSTLQTQPQPDRVAESPRVTARMCPKATGRVKRISRHARREELAISNLLTFPTLGQAATATRVSERTMRRWLMRPEFAKRFRAAKRNVLDAVVDTLLRGADQCASGLVKLAADKRIPAPVRARASVKVIELVVKAVAIADLEERLARVEETLARRTM